MSQSAVEMSRFPRIALDIPKNSGCSVMQYDRITEQLGQLADMLQPDVYEKVSESGYQMTISKIMHMTKQIELIVSGLAKVIVHVMRRFPDPEYELSQLFGSGEYRDIVDGIAHVITHLPPDDRLLQFVVKPPTMIVPLALCAPCVEEVVFPKKTGAVRRLVIFPLEDADIAAFTFSVHKVRQQISDATLLATQMDGLNDAIASFGTGRPDMVVPIAEFTRTRQMLATVIAVKRCNLALASVIAYYVSDVQPRTTCSDAKISAICEYASELAAQFTRTAFAIRYNETARRTEMQQLAYDTATYNHVCLRTSRTTQMPAEQQVHCVGRKRCFDIGEQNSTIVPSQIQSLRQFCETVHATIIAPLID